MTSTETRPPPVRSTISTSSGRSRNLTVSDRRPLHNRPREPGRNPIAISEPLPRRAVCTEYCLYQFLTTLYGISYFIVGLLMLVIGVWVMSIKKSYQAVNDVLTVPATMTIVVAIVMLLTAAVGVIGSTKDKLVLLRVFLAIVVAVFVIQVAIGIISYIYREETMETISNQMRSAIQNYLDIEEIRITVNRVQQQNKCCGLSEPKDWDFNTNYTCANSWSSLSCGVPDSCCLPIVENCGIGARNNATIMAERGIYKVGCGIRLLSWIENKLDIVGAIALGFAILHVIGIFNVYMLAVNIEDRRQLYKYRARYYNNN